MPKKHLTDHVPYSLAGQLKKAGYWNPGCTYSSCYNGPCYIIHSKKFFEHSCVIDWEDVLPAPTYAEVVDWLMEKGLAVEVRQYLRPEWTSHISRWDSVNPDNLFESEPGTWTKVMNAAIKKAMAILKASGK